MEKSKGSFILKLDEFLGIPREENPKTSRVFFISAIAIVLFLVVLSIQGLFHRIPWYNFSFRLLTISVILVAIIVKRLINQSQFPGILVCVALLNEIIPPILLSDGMLRIIHFWFPLFVIVAMLIAGWRVSIYMASSQKNE